MFRFHHFEVLRVNPVLENLRWRVVNGHLELTATDLDNSLHMSMPFAGPAIENNTDVLVPAKELYQIVKTETAPKLEIQIRGGKFELHANNRSLVLPCSEPKNFPQIPDGELKLQGQILASALDAALHRVLFCVSAEASRYSTDVLRLEMRDSVFRLVGTDGHRLSLIEGAAKSEGSSTTLLLRSTGAILNRLGLAEEPRWVQFSTCGSEQEFLMFILPDGAGLIARRGQGQFPNIPASEIEAGMEPHLPCLVKLGQGNRRMQDHRRVLARSCLTGTIHNFESEGHPPLTPFLVHSTCTGYTYVIQIMRRTLQLSFMRGSAMRSGQWVCRQNIR
jgi:hypothetical protein